MDDAAARPDRPDGEGPPGISTVSEPDDALILWMLSLTPTERLEVAQGFVDSIQALRDGQDQLQGGDEVVGAIRNPR